MLRVMRSDERGFRDHGWLKTHHSFSFADYMNPEAMGWGHLRVINEDVINAGEGFGWHGHKDMEIITFVTSGKINHEDSMGHVKSIEPHEVQVMSAGRGVFHSEFNGIKDQPTKLYQIWIRPDTMNVDPRYEQKSFKEFTEKNGFHWLVGSMDSDAPLKIHQDTKIHWGNLKKDELLKVKQNPKRWSWLHLISGGLTVNEHEILRPGDALGSHDISEIRIQPAMDSQFLFFDTL